MKKITVTNPSDKVLAAIANQIRDEATRQVQKDLSEMFNAAAAGIPSLLPGETKIFSTTPITMEISRSSEEPANS